MFLTFCFGATIFRNDLIMLKRRGGDSLLERCHAIGKNQHLSSYLLLDLLRLFVAYTVLNGFGFIFII